MTCAHGWTRMNNLQGAERHRRRRPGHRLVRADSGIARSDLLQAEIYHAGYGASGAMADALARVAAIRDDDGGSPGDTLAEYAYLGLGRIVTEDHLQPQVKLNDDSGTPGEYAGFDAFGRVIDHRWYAYGASADRDRYTYGYDRASNVTAQ